MIRLTTSLLLAGLLIVFSGCEKNLETPERPKIDESLPIVKSSTIRTISDINSIALEWKSVKVANAAGYYIIRKDMQVDGTFKRVGSIENKYATHYLDKDLMPNSKYAYKISVMAKNGYESIASGDVSLSTLPNLKSVSLIDTVSDLPRQIKVLWRPHSDKRVSKYIIQRTSPSSPKWEKIKTVKDRLSVEYIDTKLGDNETYTYRIKSVTFDKILSEPSDISSATTKPLPDQISQLEATTNLPKKIQLSWGESKTKDVVLYNIYKASSVGGTFSKIAKAPVEHNRFDDEVSEDGKIYFYKITTVDKDHLESDIKNINPVMGQTLTKPTMPNITLAQIQGNKIILNWRSSDERVVSFNIYKKTKDGWTISEEKLIPNVTGLRFEDPDVVRGVEYGYAIQAVDKNGLVSVKTDEVTSMLPKIAVPESKN